MGLNVTLIHGDGVAVRWAWATAHGFPFTPETETEDVYSEQTEYDDPAWLGTRTVTWVKEINGMAVYTDVKFRGTVYNDLAYEIDAPRFEQVCHPRQVVQLRNAISQFLASGRTSEWPSRERLEHFKTLLDWMVLNHLGMEGDD